MTLSHECSGVEATCQVIHNIHRLKTFDTLKVTKTGAVSKPMAKLTNKDREAFGEIARSAAYLATHGKPELAVALSVYLAGRIGHPVDAVALSNELTDIGHAEREAK